MFTALLIHQAFLVSFQTLSETDLLFQELFEDAEYSGSYPAKSRRWMQLSAAPWDNLQTRDECLPRGFAGVDAGVLGRMRLPG